jgi:hypothetical protein
MPLEAFYRTMGQLCFTLLGLWWLVVQTKHSAWSRDSERRRTVVNISLYFLLPGSMSLLAALSAEERILWRLAFAAASGLGLVEALILVFRSARSRNSWLAMLLHWGAPPLYVLIILVAVVPNTARLIGVTPLTMAGTLLALLVILGTALALAYFVEPLPEDR